MAARTTIRSTLPTLFLAALPTLALAQTPAPLYSFTAEPDGNGPRGAPLFHAGKIYGTTLNGGTTDNGAIYGIDPKTNAKTILYSFAGGADGSQPETDLLFQAGSLYGTTTFGGANNGGTVFKFDLTTGTETILYSFGAGADATTPVAGLTYFNGLLYGTTAAGGGTGQGAIFAVNPRNGHETLLHSFDGVATDGARPFAGLTLAGSVLYGNTLFGGPAATGTIFQFDPATGTESLVYSFKKGSRAGTPSANLTLMNNILYGTTNSGGFKKCEGSFCGTIFSFDPATRTFTTLYSFANLRDGEDPEGTLVALGGVLYGATLSGGHDNLGTTFKFDTATGTETKLHDFTGVPDGTNPASLIYHHGALYGTARCGGNGGFGTVFKFKP